MPEVDGYKIERADDAEFTDHLTGIALTKETEWTDLTVKDIRTYNYRVRSAKLALGDSPWVQTCVQTGSTSAAPAGLRADADGGTVRLEWAPVHGKVFAYEILRGVSAGKLEPYRTCEIGKPGLLAAVFVEHGVAPGKYFYAVRAVYFSIANPSEMQRSSASQPVAVSVADPSVAR